MPTGTAGRAAADELNGTPFGRPENVAQQFVNGTEVLYFTATSERAVYAVFLDRAVTAEVKRFADRSTLNIASGEPVGTALSSPDNLAVDGNGHVYIVEDQGPDASDTWRVTETDCAWLTQTQEKKWLPSRSLPGSISKDGLVGIKRRDVFEAGKSGRIGGH